MADKLFISKPGGAILQEAHGESVIYVYGQEVDKAKLSDAQVEHLDHVTTSKKPDAVADAISLDQGHHERAALAEAGQPNSTSSPIPGNYDELDEDSRVRFIQQLESHPKSQAVVVAYEVAHENSSKVVDAAGESARIEAKELDRAGEFQESLVPDIPDTTKAQAKDALESAGSHGQDADTEGIVAPVRAPGVGAVPQGEEPPETPAPTSEEPTTGES